MFLLRKPSIGDEVLLHSIDWLENLPWRQESDVKAEKDKYEIRLNVRDFGPKDLSVKVADGFVIVEAKHEERKDELGYVTRHIKRKYALPEDCIAEKLESKLSADGVLLIVAPRKQVVRKDTVIPVSHESKSCLKSKL